MPRALHVTSRLPTPRFPWPIELPRWSAVPIPVSARALREAGLPALTADLLAQRGIADAGEAERFLAPSVDQLHAGPMAGLEEAVEALAATRSRGGAVLLVGDYDVDGISATALLLASMRACGLSAQAILPNRLRDGYGLQPSHVERALALRAEVLVTVDCGTTAVESVALALDRGLRVVVVDHHRPGDPLPEGAILVNPQQPGCPYPFRHLAAAGLAFKVALALAQRCRRPLPVEALLRVACLGTIADMVPLVGENRVLAALGLEALARARSPGLRELFRQARLRAPFEAADVGFRLGPRLNAAGRLGSADPALELLLTRDPRRAREICSELEQLNGRRRVEQERVVSEALAGLSGLPSLPPVVAWWSPTWHPGVVGIAATRISRLLNRPAILLAVDGDSATGSGRSVPGLDLFDFLRPWQERMERFGGHAQAIGLRVRSSRLEELRSGWIDAAGEWPPGLMEPVHSYHRCLAPEELDGETLEQLDRLAPWGEGNPQPLLRVGPLRLARDPTPFGNGHLRGIAHGPGGGRVSLLGWGWAEQAGKLQGEVDVLGYLERNRLTGDPELRLIDSRPSSS